MGCVPKIQSVEGNKNKEVKLELVSKVPPQNLAVYVCLAGALFAIYFVGCKHWQSDDQICSQQHVHDQKYFPAWNATKIERCCPRLQSLNLHCFCVSVPRLFSFGRRALRPFQSHGKGSWWPSLSVGLCKALHRQSSLPVWSGGSTSKCCCHSSAFVTLVLECNPKHWLTWSRKWILGSGCPSLAFDWIWRGLPSLTKTRFIVFWFVRMEWRSVRFYMSSRDVVSQMNVPRFFIRINGTI